MAATILGVDIGYNSVKLALCKGGVVKRSAVVPMPANLMRDGRVTSPDTMSELIRSAMKEYGMRANKAALVLSDEAAYLRTVTIPRMTADQLLYNLPYEFNDYITDELKNYVFDYAMVSDSAGEDGASMELLAVAMPAAELEDRRAMLRRAGLRLVKAAPVECSFISLIRALGAPEDPPLERCVIDIGYRAIRMYMFRGDLHKTTRVIEYGLSTLDDVVAEAYSVDVHLAHTYLLTNHEDCQNNEVCINAYNNIAVELMRAMNFYRFSNADSTLNDVWICGGGAVIRPLRSALAATLDMEIHPPETLVPGGEDVEDCNSLVQAVGATLD